MRTLLIVAAAACISLTGCTDVASETESSGVVEDNTELNKRLAREFYENLWFEQNTEVFADYVADEYVIHDMGDTKGAMPTEPAVTQKEIADRFHSFGKITEIWNHRHDVSLPRPPGGSRPN